MPSDTLESLVVGSSPAMKKIRADIAKVSNTNLPVLILGETGTGKGVVARSLHQQSSRRKHPFLEINCANVPRTLLESELFGYKLGAFTGAWRDKPGKFQLASSGTIFLDEIAEMHLQMQAKLLQVLQDGRISAVGEAEDSPVDVRIIAATNGVLEELIAHSLFRSDLYFRLAVICLTMPPLRERPEDVQVLSSFFVDKYCRFYQKKHLSLSGQLQTLFANYHWPGNVRELENMIKTLVAMESEDLVLEEMQRKLGHNGQGFERAAAELQALYSNEKGLKAVTAGVVQKAEKQLIRKTLAWTKGNKKQAAELLGISYKSLLNKAKSYGLNDVADTST